MEAIAALDVMTSQPLPRSCSSAWNTDTHSPPVMNTISTPTFFTIDLCKVKTAGTGEKEEVPVNQHGDDASRDREI